MERFHVIRHPLGGSDVYDETGKQVGYSLPSILGDGEDFYDMSGNPVGQSFDSVLGGEAFSGQQAGGFMDEEIMMGRNAWLDGNPFEQAEDFGMDGLNDFDSVDIGKGLDVGPDYWNDDFE